MPPAVSVPEVRAAAALRRVRGPEMTINFWF